MSSISLCLSSENVFYSMEKKIARVIWSRGKYSNVYRSTIVDPSPLKEGQKVSVLWGKTKKEFSAVVECYPVQPASREPSSQESLAPRKAKAKRRLVRIYFRSKTLTTLALRIDVFLGIDFKITSHLIHRSKNRHYLQRKRQLKLTRRKRRKRKKRRRKKKKGERSVR